MRWSVWCTVMMNSPLDSTVGLIGVCHIQVLGLIGVCHIQVVGLIGVCHIEELGLIHKCSDHVRVLRAHIKGLGYFYGTFMYNSHVRTGGCVYLCVCLCVCMCVGVCI
jgi:hypothetical protein